MIRLYIVDCPWRDATYVVDHPPEGSWRVPNDSLKRNRSEEEQKEEREEEEKKTKVDTRK
jgi:hypothetical protein